MVKSSTLYDQIITKDPNPIDFMWFANSNFINMSPDANKIINEVLPNISTIVTVDPYWTWTAKYSDYVLPACNYWEKWDFLDRSPWVFFQSPAVTPAGESKSDVEIMSLLAAKVGLGDLWSKTDEEWVRSFVNEEPSGLGGLRFRQGRGRGHLGTSRRHLRLPDRLRRRRVQDAFHEVHVLQRRPGGIRGGSALLQAHVGGSEGPARREVPLVFLQYHDRMNVHTQHIGIPALAGIQDEPLLEMNPVDAKARGIADGDVVSITNDRGACKMKVFVTEGIVPGTVATQSGWTPDYTIEGNYQTLTHLTLNPTEEHISQTCTAFYDVLVEVEKA